MESNTIVKTEDLSKTFKIGGQEVRALSKVNLEVKRGEFVAIMGPSGSGKTTLLTLIGCLDKPTEGRIYLGRKGIDVITVRDSSLYKIRRNNLGFIFQSYNLIPGLSAIENVELPMEGAKKSGKKRRERARELLSLVEIADREKHKPAQLSGGEQQRVAVARALANDPALILADEPTGNLDSETGLSIMNVLRKLTADKNRTVIIVTHNSSIAKLADRTIIIRDGKLQEEATHD
ncbi:MAG TPA: ABC transporter ATP-binding protein [Dehalococcoidia bacterium]|nr:ABC transporter ATP-binding protein [Dehalococcoidia bacterium]